MKIEDKIRKIIKKSDNVFISGHKDLDLDAIGACIGVSCICNHYKKDNYIILDDKESELGVSKIIDESRNRINLINTSMIPDLYKNNSILIIVDTNKAHLLQNDKILHYFKNIIVIDHHQLTDQSITNTINIVDDTASSACEIITYLIKKYKVEISKEEATIVLSGIVLDTNNFTVKTNEKTYYAAYLLSTFGANSKKVQYYLKEDIKNYIIRHKVIANAEIINSKYAVAMADNKKIFKKEELAKIADQLLNFNGILASFVIGKKEDDYIGISARSEGNVDVGKITEALGGGGDICNAACNIKNMDIKDIKNELIEVLNKED